MKDLIAWEKIALEDGRIRQVLFDGPGTFFLGYFFTLFLLGKDGVVRNNVSKDYKIVMNFEGYFFVVDFMEY